MVTIKKDVVCIGGGIMSVTLAKLIQELDPNINITIYPKTPKPRCKNLKFVWLSYEKTETVNQKHHQRLTVQEAKQCSTFAFADKEKRKTVHIRDKRWQQVTCQR